MKNIYLTFAFMISILIVTAQSHQVGPELSVPQGQKASFQKAMKSAHSSKSAVSSRWYNYAAAVDNFYGGNSTLSRNYLFPDSNILANFAAEADGTPWVHSIATIIDPKIEYFQENGEQLITNSNAYSIDSATMYTKYYRGTDPSIVDTLRFEFFTTNNSSEVPTYYFTGMAGDYGSDTLYFKGIKRNIVTLNIPSKIVVDYLLTEADSTSDAMTGFNIFSVAVAGLNINAGEVAGVSATFLPGYSYTATDTLNNKNYMSFYSYEEQGDNTFPVYTPGDYNSSQLITIYDLRPGSGWATLYVPAWAYGASFGFENHLIEFLITADADFTGIEATTNNSLTVEQNFPNPFNGSTTVEYSLEKSSNVSISVFNVTGAQVMTIEAGVKSVGSHTINIDGSNLQAGVYYYTLTANNNSVTKKMIVY